MVPNLVLLKLGGSLITDKTQTETARQAVLHRLALEVQEARKIAPGLHLLLGHGSGSFGHMVASKHGTRSGVRSQAEWLGFAEVAHAAARLNRMVVQAFLEAGVPVWSVQPSAGSWCARGKLVRWTIEPIIMALQRGLVPLVYGDALLDTELGGTIASTEELFSWLVDQLTPQSLVLAGNVDGVYAQDPLADPDAEHWPEITPATLPDIQAHLGGSHGVDVTGGMLSKVTEMVNLVATHPGLEVRLISGAREGAVTDALLNLPSAGGTLIRQHLLPK